MNYMNSEWFQKRYHDVYTTFFQSNDLVVSIPHTFRRGPAVSRWSGAICIKQKLPTRIYAGAIKRRVPGVRLWDMTIYSYTKSEYITYQAYEVLWQDKVSILEDELSKVLNTLWYSKWLQINILSENPRWYGFWFFGTMLTVLTSIAYIISDQLSLEKLDDYDSFVTSKDFRYIYDTVCYLDTLCMWSPSMVWAYAALSHSSIPHCVLWPTLAVETLPVMKDVWEELVNHYMSNGTVTGENINIRALDQLFDSTLKVWDIPLDYGILSFWVGYNSEDTKKQYTWFKDAYSELHDFFDILCKNNDIESTDIIHKSFPLQELDAYLHLWMLHARRDVFSKKNNKNVINTFIQSVASTGMYNTLIERDFRNITDLYSLYNTLKQSDDEKIGRVPISSSKDGGSLLFVCPRDISRSTIEKLLDRVHSLWYVLANYSYLSWRDGYWSKEWLIVDQYISQDQYSRFVKPGSVLFLWWDGTRYIWSHEDVLEHESKGLLLDAIYNKIYIDGTRLTHKDLQSQSTTVDIISRLLDADWEYIHNTSLPVSSYMKNKNEMLGKIFLPFARLIKKTYDIELDLECTGSYGSYQMRLKTDWHTFLHRIRPMSP